MSIEKNDELLKLQKTALLYDFEDIFSQEINLENAQAKSECKNILEQEVFKDDFSKLIEEANHIARAFKPVNNSKNDKLLSIFDSLNFQKGKETDSQNGQDHTFYPDFNRVLESICSLKNKGKNQDKEQEIHPTKLLDILGEYFSFVPARGYDPSDISYFDHAKISTAIAGCMYSYDKKYAKNYSNEKRIFEEERAVKKFLVVAGEFSGIQEFIYTIISKSAMKSLRGRSFFLELFTEHIIDEILEKSGLNRINLLYSGASMFYLLLPNDKDIVDNLMKFKKLINDYLIENFGTKLYFELSYDEVSANQLGNRGENGEVSEKENYIGNIFRNTSKMASINKISRYDKEQLGKLFDPNSGTINRIDSYTSECKICKKSESDKILEENSKHLDFECCNSCSSLISLGKEISKAYVRGTKTDAQSGHLIVLYNSEKTPKKDKGIVPVILPTIDRGYVKVEIVTSDKICDQKDNIRRYYNTTLSLDEMTELEREIGKDKKAVTIKLANYNVTKEDVEKSGEDKNSEADKDGLIEFEELGKRSQGINRLGVFRADVDNLGTIFQSGFGTDNITIAKSAVMSRKLSEFFKGKMNSILEMDEFYLNAPDWSNPASKYIFGKKVSVSKDEEFVGFYDSNDFCRIIGDFGTGNSQTDNPKKRDIVLLYSGGDDLFAIGTWNDIIEFSIDLRNAFKKFSNGNVTLSAGIGLFGSSYPVYNMAEKTATLESMAKAYEIKEIDGNIKSKNAVSIFGRTDILRYKKDKSEKNIRNDENGADSDSVGNCSAKEFVDHTYAWDVFVDKVIGEKYKFLKETATLEDDKSSDKVFIGKSRWYIFMDLILRRLSSCNNKLDIARFAYSIARMSVSENAKNNYENLKKQLFEWIKEEDDAKQLYTAINILIYEIREK